MSKNDIKAMFIIMSYFSVMRQGHLKIFAKEFEPLFYNLKNLYPASKITQNHQKEIMRLAEIIDDNMGNEHKITAVEYNPQIAEIYKEYYPNDTVIIADAHQYLLEHFQEYDFIWASPPCPTHSRTNYFLKGKNVSRYPDMTLYQEIILLQHFYKGKWVIENVIPYYEPLIKPTVIINRHYFWSNIYIPEKNFEGKQNIEYLSSTDTIFGFNLLKYRIKNKRRILRNLVNPLVGYHILKCAINNITDRQGKLGI